MKKIILTGSTGFLGRALTSRLNREGFQTVGLIYANSDKGARETFAKENVYFTRLADLGALVNWETVDAVVHLATNYGRSGSEALEMCNVDLPTELLNLSQQFDIPNFINADTFFSDLPVSYTHLREYRESKLRFREFARSSAGFHKTKVVNLRIFHMYGPNDAQGKFVQEMLELISSNVASIDLTNGVQKRDFVYIDDVVEAFLCVLTRSEKISTGFTGFDVCTHRVVSIKSFLLAIKERWGTATKLNFGALPCRQGEVHLEGVMSDNSGLVELGWLPKFTYLAGIDRMFNELGGEN